MVFQYSYDAYTYNKTTDEYKRTGGQILVGDIRPKEMWQQGICSYS